jgi:hypothetical protein
VEQRGTLSQRLHSRQLSIEMGKFHEADSMLPSLLLARSFFGVDASE